MSDQSTVSYREIPGFPGYRVGDDGSIWSSLKKIGLGDGGGVRYEPSETWTRMKPTRIWSGHLEVRLRGKRKKVHHLVLEAFVGPKLEGMEACHFPDRDPSNNALNNLRWDTHQANVHDQFAHQTDNRGERNGQSKLDAQTVSNIRRDFAEGMSVMVICEKYHIKYQHAYKIRNRQSWVHVS